MAEATYPWKRFWYARGKTPILTPDGYLYDPEGPYGYAQNPMALPLDAYISKPCIVLLGESGIGKSSVMKEHLTYTRQQMSENGVLIQSIRLQKYDSGAYLAQELFQSTWFKNWHEGDKRLYLFLDDLDESLLQIKTIAKILSDEIPLYPADRLFLRIACRTGVWPSELEDTFRNHWGNGLLEVLELAPLRRVDIENAAKIRGLDPATFLQAIETKQAAPLVTKPLTLKFMLNTYIQTRRLPERKAELYEQGLLQLCDEDDPQKIVGLNAAQRLKLAEQVAFITIFTNHNAIWAARDEGNVPISNITISQLTTVLGENTALKEGEIREILRTGLFTARPGHALGWAHKTYEEYLAARYLSQNRILLPQVLRLILHPADNRVILQLQETVAWIASMRTDIFDTLMMREPVILLWSDALELNPDSQKKLTETLIRLFENGELLNDFTLHPHYRKLIHSDLVDQLRPYIVDQVKANLVRRVAMDIADACMIEVLHKELLNITLNLEETLPTRIHAAYILSHSGSSETKRQLRPLALGLAGNDPEDELRGYGLQATWPDHLTAEELFTNIPPPQRESLLGGYASFLIYSCAAKIAPEALPTALRWATTQTNGTPFYRLRELADQIMHLGWKHIDFPSVLEAFAGAASARLRSHIPILVTEDRIWGGQRTLDQKRFYEEWLTSEQKRRRLFIAMLPFFTLRDLQFFMTIFGTPPLLVVTDFNWLLEQLAMPTNGEQQEIIISIIGRLFRIDDPDHVDLLHKSIISSTILAEKMGHVFRAIDLNSPEAQLQKELYQQQEESPQAKTVVHDPQLAQVIQQHRADLEAGELTKWWELTSLLIFDEDGKDRNPSFEFDLRKFPGWKKADEEMHTLILNTAKPYLYSTEPGPSPDTWLAYAGYWALLLLLHEVPDELDTIAPNVWVHWVPIITTCRVSNDQGKQKEHQTLVFRAYQKVPAAMLEQLSSQIDQECRMGEPIWGLWQWAECWDKQFIDALVEKAQELINQPKCLRPLLEGLLSHNSQGARELAVDLLTVISAEGVHRQNALTAAQLLTWYTTDASWPLIWSVIERDKTFGRDLIERLASQHHGSSAWLSQKLTEEALAELYIWTVEQYPLEEDPHIEGYHQITPRESVTDWREGLLHGLQQKGTPEALQAIQHLINVSPKHDRLQMVLIRAQDHMRRQTWVPCTLDELTSMMREIEKGFVERAAPGVLSGSGFYGLVMKGGGAKGFAYLGALKILRPHYSFNWFVGTSAGAIAAVLLGAGFTVEELETLLAEKNFNDFRDARLSQAFWNLITHRGLYHAHDLTKWLEYTLSKKLEQSHRVLLKDLPHRVTIYASQRGKKALVFDSHDPETANYPAAVAVRCSMSIPGIFIPERHGGLPVVDGGMQNNYPLDHLLTTNPGADVLGLYLGPEHFEGYSRVGPLRNAYAIWTEAVDEDALRKHHDKTIVIDPRPITTLDFALTAEQRDFLVMAGTAAALRFVRKRGLHPTVTEEVAEEAREKTEQIRRQLQAQKEKRNKQRKHILRLIILVIMVLIYVSGISLLAALGVVVILGLIVVGLLGYILY